MSHMMLIHLERYAVAFRYSSYIYITGYKELIYIIASLLPCIALTTGSMKHMLLHFHAVYIVCITSCTQKNKTRDDIIIMTNTIVIIFSSSCSTVSFDIFIFIKVPFIY